MHFHILYQVVDGQHVVCCMPQCKGGQDYAGMPSPSQGERFGLPTSLICWARSSKLTKQRGLEGLSDKMRKVLMNLHAKSCCT
jgi:hypothetical protein